jgi:hypothetical protein
MPTMSVVLSPEPGESLTTATPPTVKGRGPRGKHRSSPEARLEIAIRRETLRALQRCINGPIEDRPGKRLGVVHGPVVSGGKCQHCVDVAKASRALRANGKRPDSLTALPSQGLTRYQRQRLAGKCVVCSQPAPSRAWCDDCTERGYARQRARRKRLACAGLCQDCTEPAGPGHAYCEGCRKHRAEAQRSNKGIYSCRVCGSKGHNARTCAKGAEVGLTP